MRSGRHNLAQEGARASFEAGRLKPQRQAHEVPTWSGAPKTYAFGPQEAFRGLREAFSCRPRARLRPGVLNPPCTAEPRHKSERLQQGYRSGRDHGLRRRRNGTRTIRRRPGLALR